MTSLRSACALAVTLAALQSACAESNAWTQGTDDAAYEEVYVLAADATGTVLDEYGSKEVTPRMEFRCTKGSPELGMRIDWGRFINSFNTEAGFTVDEGKQNWVAMSVDDSNKVTIVRASGDVDSLAAELGKGDLLSVEIAPYSEAAVSVSFDLAGFANSLGNLREMCQ